MSEAHQAVLLGEHMHGATLAPADARLLAKQLRHDLPGGHILAKGVHVIAVGGADVILPSQLPDDASGDGFLL